VLRRRRVEGADYGSCPPSWTRGMACARLRALDGSDLSIPGFEPDHAILEPIPRNAEVPSLTSVATGATRPTTEIMVVDSSTQLV